MDDIVIPDFFIDPMDCADMVVMAAQGEYSRIHDAFSKDRSTPKLDTYYNGGVNSLTAAIGKEENGMTTVLFRRKLQGTNYKNYDDFYP